MKATLVFNFCHFVEWPERAFAAADAPFVIAILGTDPFGRFLDELVAQEKVRGRPLTVIRVETPEKANSAHLVYVGRSESGRLNAVFAALKGKPCLTIGESATGDFAGRGGMIEFLASRAVLEHPEVVPVNLFALLRGLVETSASLARGKRIRHPGKKHPPPPGGGCLNATLHSAFLVLPLKMVSAAGVGVPLFLP